MTDTDAVTQALAAAYDETPYQSNAFSISAPAICEPWRRCMASARRPWRTPAFWN